MGYVIPKATAREPASARRAGRKSAHSVRLKDQPSQIVKFMDSNGDTTVIQFALVRRVTKNRDNDCHGTIYKNKKKFKAIRVGQSTWIAHPQS